MVNETEGEIDVTSDHKESYSPVGDQGEGGINVSNDNCEHTSSAPQMNDHQIVDENKCNGATDNFKNEDLIVVDHEDSEIANDVPLINKSDLILINVCNATKSNEEDDKQEKNNDISLVNLANAKQEEEEDVKIDEWPKENSKQMETKIEVNVKASEEPAINAGNSEDVIVKIDEDSKPNPKAESNGIHNEDVKEEKSDDKQRCSDENEPKSPSENKKSFWSRMWRSKQSTDSTSPSQDTDIEVIESPSGEKKANSSGNNSDTTTDVTVAICTDAEPQKKLDENELTPTHLLFRVKSPYFKYIFSFTIFALLILLFAAAAIYLFPEKFDIRYLSIISGRSSENDTITTTIAAPTVVDQFEAVTTNPMETNMNVNLNSITNTNMNMNMSIANTESDRIYAFTENATAYFSA